MLSIVRDITEQKRGEEALWVSEEKLRIALEVGHTDSWDWDIESNLICWSAHLDAPFGLAGEGALPVDSGDVVLTLSCPTLWYNSGTDS